ncbi:MAG: hypothetical protein J5842_08640, partial [Lachnospiraceae bacterium]|nr:hypothetical protein [Lachnospiraceae bacterium]
MKVTNEFHIAFYAAALTIAITVLLFTILQKRTDRRQNRLFMNLIFILIANAIATTGAAIAEPYASSSRAAYTVLDTCQFFYFLLHTALCPMLYYYVMSVTGVIRKRSRRMIFLTAIPLIVTEIFVLINPFLGCVYYYDSNYKFHRNWAEYLIYGVAALYFALAMAQLFFAWNAINMRRRIALVYFFLLSIIGIVIQFVDINIKSELFAEAIALMGVMLAVESEDDRRDADTGIYNRKALQMDVNNFMIMKEAVPFIFIKIINSDIIERVTGSANVDLMSGIIADFLKTLVPRYRIYHPNPECFVISCPGYLQKQVQELRKSIVDRFALTWRVENSAVFLQAAVIPSFMPGELGGVEDIFFV